MKLLKTFVVCGALSILGGVSFAGAVDGPTNLTETVQQGKIDVYRISFAGGKKATVRAKSAPGDLDLLVYDSHDNLVAKDESDGGDLVCAWTPKQSEEFKIKVVNNEQRAIDYKLDTN